MSEGEAALSAGETAMSEQAPTLDPIHLPLPGSRLIEASAGTGKTFTIALLYLRLVLGPRDEHDSDAFPRPLTPPEILVVTFTNAATQELRERIRARLVEAADAFQPDTSTAATGGDADSGSGAGAPGTASGPAEGASGAGLEGGPMPGMASVAPRDGFTAPPERPAPEEAPSRNTTTDLFAGTAAPGSLDEAAESGASGTGTSGDHSTGMLNVASTEGFTASPLGPGADKAPPTEQAPPRNQAADPLLALRDSYPRESWPAYARRLRLAAEWMDEAAVSTIHAWCHRMLREHAFDSGSLFALAMELDQSAMNLEIARDYWRSFYYALEPEELGVITRHWKSPDALNQAVDQLRVHADALPEAPEPATTLANARQERERILEELKAPWREWIDDLQQQIEEAASRKAFDGKKLNVKNRTNWFDKLRSWAHDPEAIHPGLTDAAWQRLTPEGMAEIWKDGSPIAHPALEATEPLKARLDSLPEPFADLLSHAVHWMAKRRNMVQRRRAELGPDDLLHHLDAAFQGEAGETLATRIRQQFPVALVDEFQDTDPVQYRLFDHVYQLADNHQDCAVLLIGDPKQAIYAFRGADIHTYLKARRDTQGRHVTLGTNFRSAAAMVGAVNRVFAHAEANLASGAFLFRQGEEDPVPFQSVAAKGRKDALVRQGTPQPALSLWHLEAEAGIGKGAYINELAERCASEMARLLNEGQAGQTGFAHREDDSFRPLAPSDLAVLVNSGSEARAIRRALLQRGVRSVYLSDKEGVYETEAAAELELWLAACAEPDNARALRAALASPSLGLTLAELDALNGGDQQDELAWEARVMQFRDYHRQWWQRGVLPMLHQMLADFAVPGRLLTVPEGERRLTDLLHLGELLQQASTELDGEHALLRHLREAIGRPQEQSEAHKLRLESDADLVQVVTIHKSKGLEYPLVFLPFIAAARQTKKDDLPLRWHDDEGRLRLSLEADEAIRERADHERLSEDMRKLYVALTRARHATWLGLAPLEQLEHSAIGRLIGGDAPLDGQSLRPALEPLDDTHHPDGSTDDGARMISVCEAPARDATPVPSREDTTPLAPARSPSRRIREHWWIASYSALGYSQRQASDTADEPSLPSEPTTPGEESAREVHDEPRDSGSLPLHGGPAGEGALHAFPRGPSAGTFLHGLLEWAGEQGFARVAEDADLRDETIARRAKRRGWEHQIPALRAWLPELLSAELPLPGGDADAGGTTPLRLDRLSRYRVEMEFWLAVHQVDTRQLDTLVSRHTLGGRARPALDPDRLNGMLKGFIDLVAEHQGRYYVLDWKSNHLGADDAAYAPEAMTEAVLAKRYDVQYCLYLLALHRLLKARQPGYDIERHLGGALYVFLRGSRSPSRGVHAECPPRELIEGLDALFRAAEEAAA
ncbi:RecBCD enzyme subunit RecB [Halomonas halmophila]|uniref:RecBCD enzyme subunit RecB n=2 Tax=Halomonas halmophila TaxID=252 RepID=A0A4Y4F5D1_9GAMM|nr:exodeoxyribonuclease V subunit beta [Halomonas halmophila]GED22318.1 RecBCD enzyme subunit RecB [Halomonas halmophila]